VAARGSAAGTEGVAEEEDEEEDGERGPHGYVSILRSAVLRGCNVTLMARVHGNYKKRKLNIEHIVPWDTVYEEIAQLFYEVGMQVHGRPLSPPNIIFWNVRADTYGYPAAADQKGVMLLSGYSPALMKFILSGEMEEEVAEALDADGNGVKTRRQVDPREALRRVLNDSGLDAVRTVLDTMPDQAWEPA